LKAIYDNAPVMICVVDTDRRVVNVNPAFTAFTSKTKRKSRADTHAVFLAVSTAG
jgi:PAS domain S-box-containing protein